MNKLIKSVLAVLIWGGGVLVALADDDWTGAPDYYVEYVASTSGGNQYIDTGVTAASPLLAEMEMAWVTVPSDGSFLATRPGNGSNRFYLLHYYQNWTLGYGDYKNSPLSGTSKAVAGQKYKIVTSLAAGSQTMSIDGVPAHAQTIAGERDTGATLYLFACNITTGGVKYQSVSRCYSLKISKEGVTLRDFRPCVKNGEPCLYDKVTKGYFRNAAATALEAGPKVEILEEDALWIAGSPMEAGVSTPEYGKIVKLAVGGTVECSLATNYVNYAGSAYTCNSYTLETSEDSGATWENPTTHEGSSCTYTFEGTLTRLTWNWTANNRHVLEVPVPSTGIVAEPVFSVQPGVLGEYDAGTEVTITVSRGTGEFYGTNEWDDAEFDHWEGDVPEGLERTNPLTVTMDRPRRIVPIFAHEWVCRENDVDTSGLKFVMCDGYWTIRVDDTVAPSGRAGLITGSPAAWELATILDFRKHIRTTKGKTIVVVTVGEHAWNLIDYPALADRGVATVREVRLNDELETIGLRAFRGCVNLKTVTPFLPTNVTDVGDQAFYQSPIESELVLGGVGTQVKVGNSAFYGNAFTRMTLGEGIVYGWNKTPGFSKDMVGETRITEFVAPAWLTTIQGFKSCHSLTNVDLSAAPITAIIGECFMDCENLRTVKLPPKTLKRLEKHAFYISEGGEGGLEHVEPYLPESLEFLGDDLFNRQVRLAQPLEIGSRKHFLEVDYGFQFYSMPALKTVTIRGGVTNLTNQCFAYSTGLDDFYFADEDKPVIADNCFTVASENNSRFFIPRGNASWETFVAENVTPWNQLTDVQSNKYVNRYGKPPRSIIGMGPMGSGINKFYLWKPTMGMKVLVK